MPASNTSTSVVSETPLSVVVAQVLRQLRPIEDKLLATRLTPEQRRLLSHLRRTRLTLWAYIEIPDDTPSAPA